MTILKRIAATAAITISALAGTLGISAATGAGAASAAVDSGRYAFTTKTFGIFPFTQDASVRNGRLDVGGSGLRLIPTPHGAYANLGQNGRYTFVKRGQSYFGRMYTAGIPVGDVELIKKH